MTTRNPKPITRHVWQAKEPCLLNSPEAADKYIRSHIFNRFDDFEQEEMWVLLLTTRHKITHLSMVYKGTVSSITIAVSDLFRAAVRHNATKIILTHNHPSGDETPSGQDIATTEQVYKAGNLLGISVCDHLVIGRASYTSIREEQIGIFC